MTGTGTQHPAAPLELDPLPPAGPPTLPRYVFAELEDRVRAYASRGASAPPLINLGIGSPFGAMPPVVVRALEEAVADPSSVPYPSFRGDPEFLEGAAWYLRDRFGVGVDPARELFTLAGSKEGIAQLALATLGPDDVALVPDIHYPVYVRAPRLARARVVLVPMRAEHGFLPDWSGVPAATLRAARLLIVNYPNNPTGAVAPLRFYEEAVAFARANGILLVSDAAYCELPLDGTPPPAALQVPGAADVAVELFSCSKAFNMAGLRLGFIAGNAAAIDRLAEYRTSIGYGVATAIQRGGAVALRNHRALAAEIADGYRVRRDAAVAAFRRAGWDVPVPRAAMYLWLRSPDPDDWGWTARVLDEAGVAVTPGSAFGPGGAGYFRVSLVRPPEVLADGIGRLCTVDQGNANGASGRTPR